jgi:fatty acid desaturase
MYIEQKLRAEIKENIGIENLEFFQERNPLSFLSVQIFNFLIIFTLFIISFHIIKSDIYLLYLFLPFFMFLIATRQNAFNVQVHEGSHFLLHKNRYINDLLCNWVCAYWILYTVEDYRSTHFLHHRFLNTKKDPDLFLYQSDFSTVNILKGFFLDICGVSAFKRFSAISKNHNKRYVGLIPKLFLNSCILFLLIYSFDLLYGLTLYILLWILPLLCIFPAIIRIRINAEHANLYINDNKNFMPFISRTTACSFFEKFLIGAQMEYHFEHHLFPSFPYSKLKLFHELLINNGFFKKDINFLHLNLSYIKFWIEAYRSSKKLKNP